jgi:hypothetical protein
MTMMRRTIGDSLPVLNIFTGSLAELITRQYKKEQDIIPVLEDLAMCLKNHSPYSLQ